MMKITMNPQGDHQFSIMQRIIDGTLHIDSIEEFEEILEFYPNDPLLYRKFADLLADKKSIKKAELAYGRAAELFIEQGMNLQAIVAKILQWSLKKPSHDQGRRFHALLHDKGARQTPLQRFWARMSYVEMVTVMLRLVRTKMPGSTIITSVGDMANEVYFVVSGALSETPSPDCESEAADSGFDTEPSLIGTNDIFGDIFPLDQPTISQTEIRTLTEVELVKISKSILKHACSKFPNIKKLLHELYRSGSRHNCDRTWQTVRRALRFGLPTKVEISCYAVKTPNIESLHSGIAVDVSLGGMCVDLGSIPADDEKKNLKGRLCRLHLDLLNNVAELDITGKIVWQRRQLSEKGIKTLIGVRFDSLNATDRELLMEYCSGSVGEQNLLWSLWDTMVKTDNE